MNRYAATPRLQAGSRAGAAHAKPLAASGPPCERRRMTADEITRITARHTYGTWRRQRGWAPLHVTRAEGCYFWDAAGRRYLDLSSQLMCSNLGHQNPAVIEA